MKLPAYPKYKPSGVEWLGDVPEKWEVKRLKYVAGLSDVKIEANPEMPVPYIGLEHLESWTGKLLPLDLELVPSGIANQFKKGSVLFGKLRPYLAKACTPDFTGLCSTELLVLEAAKQDNRFLRYSLLTPGFISLVDSASYGVKMPRASWDFVGVCNLPLPPLPEQQAIADFLDRETARLDTLVSKKQELIERLEEKRIALISRTVTHGLNPKVKFKSSGIAWLGNVPAHWKVVALKHLVSTPIIDGPHESPAHCDEGIPFVSAESVSKEFIDFEKIWGYISPADHARYSRRFVPKRGDILMVKLGATTGVSAIVETDIEFNIWVPLAAIRLKPEIKPRFILHVLRSDNLQRAYQNTWTYGTQQTLGLQTISNLRVPFPPDTEQIAITEFLDRETMKLETLVAKIKTAVERLQEYRTALITAAVTGKIDARKESHGK